MGDLKSRIGNTSVSRTMGPNGNKVCDKITNGFLSKQDIHKHTYLFML